MKSEKSNKIKNLKSINQVLLTYFLLLAVLLIMLVETTCLIVVNTTVNSQARDRISRVGNEVVRLIENGTNPEAVIKDYRREGVNVFVLSSDGTVIVPADYNFEDANIEVFENIKDKYNGTGTAIFWENNSVVYISSVYYDGNTCFVVAGYFLNILKSGTRQLLWYFALIGVVILLIAVLVAYSASRKLTDGIKDLSSTAVRFSKGNFNVNFANAECRELADLSDTLNNVRDEVKKSDDFKRELLANVSHDLKTPLTMIKAYASMIREISGDNPEKRDKHLQVIIDEADRLTGLVNDVLSVSKVSSNLDEINFKVFNLTEFLYGIINKFEYLQETQGFTIMVDVDANLYTRADEEKIGQVVYNLLSNAINYTGDDKTVYISLKSNLAGDRIKLKIRDTGKGIAKKDLPEIWNRYYRVHETHTRPVKGSGLGLNIVKIILCNHSFDFGVESEVGKGSTFWIDFPSVPGEIDVDDNKY